MIPSNKFVSCYSRVTKSPCFRLPVSFFIENLSKIPDIFPENFTLRKFFVSIMGNALRFLYGKCCKPLTEEESGSLELHGVSAATVGLSALAQDLSHFEITSQVTVSFFLCVCYQFSPFNEFLELIAHLGYLNFDGFCCCSGS